MKKLILFLVVVVFILVLSFLLTLCKTEILTEVFCIKLKLIRSYTITLWLLWFAVIVFIWVVDRITE